MLEEQRVKIRYAARNVAALKEKLDLLRASNTSGFGTVDHELYADIKVCEAEFNEADRELSKAMSGN